MSVSPSGPSNSALSIIKWIFLYHHLFITSHFITLIHSGKEKRGFFLFCFFVFVFLLALLNPKYMEKRSGWKRHPDIDI